MDKKAYRRLDTKKKYGALQSKDIRSVLKKELITNFGFENSRRLYETKGKNDALSNDNTRKNIPHAGTVFEMGRTLTHKRQIIGEYLKCYLTKDIASKCKHHYTNVDRYISDFNRVFDLYEEKNASQILFLTGLSINLVKEYIKIIEEFTKQQKLIYSKRKNEKEK